jgi:wobble nucleotide-excising tRNase
MEKECNPNVCKEKFDVINDKIEELKCLMAKYDNKFSEYDSRLNENEKKTDKIDNQLSIKLVQLEAKLDMFTKIMGDKVDTFAKETKEINEKVEKKMDDYFKSPKPDSFKEELYRIGIKLFEFGIYGGILYAVAKGLKLI